MPKDYTPLAALEAEAAPAQVEYTLDLPPFADSIRIDGRIYFSGVTYKFTPEELASVKEIEARAWTHEQVNSGQRKGYGLLDRARAPMNYRLRG